MNRDDVWQAIDDERLSLADLFDDLSAQEWETPSLCAGWRVRDVAAHLTLAHVGPLPAALATLRARGHLNRMIRAAGQAARTRSMPVQAAATAANRVWPDLWPFRAERKLSGFRFAATDCPWTAGQGPQVEGPIAAILLLLTGRRAALSHLSGPGVFELQARARTRIVRDKQCPGSGP